MSTAPVTVPSDAFLVERIAALSDRAALAELDARHGMTLYALAYSILLDQDAADAAVAVAFREVWFSAASFDPREKRVGRWLADLVRRATRVHLRKVVGLGRGALVAPMPRVA